MSRPSIKIAITAGGLAGACPFHALLDHAHLDMHIFESAVEFKQTGAAIGLPRNALSALDLIGASTVQCLERTGAVPMRGVRFMLAQGKDKGSMIDEVDETAQGRRRIRIVQRAAFLEELLVNAPQEHMHTSKKLDRIDRNGDGSIKLHFTDGTTHKCDTLPCYLHCTVSRAKPRSRASSKRNGSTWDRIALPWPVVSIATSELCQGYPSAQLI